MIRVNLLATAPGAKQPRVWIPAEQRSSVIGLGMLAVVGLAVGGWWYYLSVQKAAAEAGIVTAEARIEELKDAMKVLEAVRQQKAELEERIGLIDRLRAAKSAPVRMLHLLNASVPEGLWLMEIKQTGATVQIEGRAMSPSSVTDFAQSLQVAGFFKMPVEIITTLMEAVEDTSVYRFLLKAEPIVAPLLTTPAATVTPPPPAARPGL